MIISTTAVTTDIESDIGIEYHTPSTPKYFGRIMRHGTRKSICLESDRKMLFFGIPMLWKKLVITICMPIIGNVTITMRMASDDSWISSSSAVNIRATSSGKNSPSMKPLVVTTVPPIIVSHSTRITRSYRPAPKSDRQDMPDNLSFKSEDAVLPSQKFVFVPEEFCLHKQSHNLRQNGGKSRSPDAHVETVHKQHIEHHVQKYRENGAQHRIQRMSGRTQNAVQTKIAVRNHVSEKDYNHIVARIPDGIVARSEEQQDGVEKNQH